VSRKFRDQGMALFLIGCFSFLKEIVRKVPALQWCGIEVAGRRESDLGCDRPYGEEGDLRKDEGARVMGEDGVYGQDELRRAPVIGAERVDVCDPLPGRKVGEEVSSPKTVDRLPRTPMRNMGLVPSSKK